MKILLKIRKNLVEIKIQIIAFKFQCTKFFNDTKFISTIIITIHTKFLLKHS